MDGGAIPLLGQLSVLAAETPFSFFSLTASQKSFLTSLVLLGPSTTASRLGRAVVLVRGTALAQLLLRLAQVLQYVVYRTTFL